MPKLHPVVYLLSLMPAFQATFLFFSWDELYLDQKKASRSPNEYRDMEDMKDMSASGSSTRHLFHVPLHMVRIRLY